jgi:uncharacterized protein with PQ loop repeat
VIFYLERGTNSAAVWAGTAKALLSVLAYLPQFILIYRNKTTRGWSMSGVWVDFLGSILAVIQITIDYFDTVISYKAKIFRDTGLDFSMN